MKKAILFFCFLIIASGMSFAVDFTQGPESAQPGNILISGGLSMGSASTRVPPMGGYGTRTFSSNLLGITLAVDYALPMYGLTVGGEIGYLSGEVSGDLNNGFRLWKIYIEAIPLMGRFGYHPDFGIPNLDLYALAKVGFARVTTTMIGFGPSSTNNFGFGIGFGAGGRYFFTGNLGAFAELGVDSFSFSTTFSTTLGDTTSNVTGRKYLTAGVTFKINMRPLLVRQELVSQEDQKEM